jgi:two-component system NtrC family response regulator
MAKLELSPEARQALRQYHWPGNVRELLHTLERAALVGAGSCIQPADLPFGPHRTDVQPSNLPAKVAALLAPIAAGQAVNMEEIEKAIVELALEKTGGNVSAAARLLSIGREAMRYRLSKFGLLTDRDGESGGTPG